MEEIKIKLHKHQIEYLDEVAKKIGKQIARRSKSGSWVTRGRVIRKILDEYQFFLRPRIKDLIKEKRLSKQKETEYTKEKK